MYRHSILCCSFFGHPTAQKNRCFLATTWVICQASENSGAPEAQMGWHWGNHIPMGYFYHLVMTNIAVGNGPFIDGLPIENGDFPWLC